MGEYQGTVVMHQKGGLFKLQHSLHVTIPEGMLIFLIVLQHEHVEAMARAPLLVHRCTVVIW
jgi:hypothetical protein